MASSHLTDLRSGQRLVRVTRRILAPGVHTAPGFGVALFAPEGTTREGLRTAALVIGRFFFTPFKAFPLLREGFEIPSLRCDGRGVTVMMAGGNAPQVLDQRLSDVSAMMPIPWPEGSVGNPGPDYVPPDERKKRDKEQRKAQTKEPRS